MESRMQSNAPYPSFEARSVAYLSHAANDIFVSAGRDRLNPLPPQPTGIRLRSWTCVIRRTVKARFLSLPACAKPRRVICQARLLAQKQRSERSLDPYRV